MNAETLEPSTDFPYLLGIVFYNNSNWVSLYQNIWKAQQQHGVVGKVVTKVGATVRVQGILYKSIV